MKAAEEYYRTIVLRTRDGPKKHIYFLCLDTVLGPEYCTSPFYKKPKQRHIGHYWRVPQLRNPVRQKQFLGQKVRY